MEKYALLSVTNKTNIVEFARGLNKLDYKVISTGGTAKVLKDAGVSFIYISEYTKQNEIMDGRVKTLHPMIHAGILARRDKDDDLQSLKDLAAGFIDVVAVNLYPFIDVYQNLRRTKTEEEMVEFIDIGGPTMLRAAAKNFSHVFSVIDFQDYELVLKSIEEGGDCLSLKRNLAAKVYAHISSYDLYVAKYLSRDIEDISGTQLSNYEGFVSQRVQNLRYGENSDQKAGWYAPLESINKLSLKQLQGKELSYNNLNDIYAAADLAIDLQSAFPEECSVSIIKHANPCGVAVGANELDMFKKAISCDPVSAFGGIVAFSCNVTREIAELINTSFYEVIMAPSFNTDALEILASKKKVRLIEIDYSVLNEKRRISFQFKSVFEGALLQSHDLLGDKFTNLNWICGNNFSSQNQSRDALLAFVVSKHVKSNAIVIASNGLVIGIGAGQMNRVDASRFAIARAESNGHVVAGSVVASDAFLPFSDNIDVFADAKIELVVQPGGSIRDEEVIDAAKSKNINMIFTGERHFRH